MHNAIPLSLAALIAVGIIVIGCFYLVSPERISGTFGLKPPASLLGLKKSWATIVQNLGQPIRDPLFDFENRASPQTKLLPVNVLIACVVKPLPRDAAGLIICPLAGCSLKLDGRVEHGFDFRFVQAGVPGKGTQGRVSATRTSERAAALV